MSLTHRGDELVSDFREAWVAELERLEVDVAEAESLLASEQVADYDPTPWSPPVMRGPLPSDLEPRARLVLERQLAVAHLLSERITRTGQQRRLAQRIRDTAHPDVPIYLDLQA